MFTDIGSLNCDWKIPTACPIIPWIAAEFGLDVIELSTNALMVDYEPSDVSWMCSSATLVGHLKVPYDVHGLEQNAPVTFCVLKTPIQQDWSRLRNFS